MLSALRQFSGLAVLVAAPCALALAQDQLVDEEGVRVFEPSYYNEFDPVSALQMVFRTPGFNPQESEGGRGLSGVRSNVLIDGKRPPPKGQSVRQRLREMPVAGVALIELIDAGARLDIDMQGFSQVVNVVTVENAPAYYEINTQIHRTGTGDVDQENARNAEVEANGAFSWGAHDFTLRGNVRDRDQRSPAGFVEIDPANPEQRITSLNRSQQQNHGVQIGAVFELPSDSSLNFTSQISSWENTSSPITLDDQDQPVDAVSQTFDNENDGRNLSAEYRRPFGSSGELTVALVDARSENQSESSLTSEGLVRSSLNDRETGETAARLMVTRLPTEQLTLRTTATTAFNFFDGGFQIFENGVELPVQGSDNRVEEDRHSLEAEVDWNLSESWIFRGNLGAEAYEIESDDASSGLQTDPTGLLSISYRPQPRTTVTFESSREIGQLSFNQFLASSSLSSEILTAGASELEPVKWWNHSASYDRRFGDVGVLQLTLSREKVDNPVRSVALSDSIIVAQNTSPETVDRLSASLEFPFERFGREDLVLGIGGMLADSETIDPVTGEKREVSSIPKRFWSLQLRRDPGDSALAWSFSVGGRTENDRYSVRQTASSSSSREWGANVEWEPIEGLKLRAQLEGPRTETWRSNFFGSVREPGLDPTFVSRTTLRMDRSASLSVEWRRRDHVEIRASLSTRPKVRNEESLTPFGEMAGTILATEIARAPQANLRFRYYR